MSELLIPDARWVWMDGWMEPGGEEVVWVLHSIYSVRMERSAYDMST